jgi:DNA-binding CsgD family transcriptional regulator/signal transduction histidine kinase
MSFPATLPTEDRFQPVRGVVNASLPGVWPVDGHTDVLPMLSDLVCASTEETAERARAALSPVLRHDALVIVAPSADGLPVRIAAPHELQERLATIDWPAIAASAQPYEEGARRFSVPDVIAGLRAAGWVASTAGTGLLVVVVANERLEIGPEQDQAARLVAMLAAARQRGIGQAPSPGTLAFSHAISQERDRVRWELASGHAATLAALLKALRDASQNGTRATPPGIAMAIDLASQALLEVKASAQRQDASLYVSGREAFADTEKQLREIARTAGLRLISGFEGSADGMLPRALARAARVVSGEAALNATRRAGGDKLRVQWRLSDDELQVTIADNGDGFKAGDGQAQAEHAHLARRIAGLGGTVSVDTAAGWGTAVSCQLPLRALSLVPETPAAEQIAQLRPREREVLELMVAGLRNREIAERLFITVRTVKFHVSNILRKFDAQSRAEVIVLAHNAGVTGPRQA